MLERLVQWKQLFVLVLLGWLLPRIVTAVYTRLRDRIDEKVPDHLPIGAGEWVLEHAEPRRIRVLRAPDEVAELDAYFPTTDAIVLSQRVYQKRDPSFWAIAAHELGHAIVHRTTFFVALPLAVARVVRAGASELATLLVIANFLYGRADLHRFAFQTLTVSLGAYLLIMVDEAAASGVGMRMLSADERLGRRDIVAAAAGLGAAFMTYCAGFIGQLILFAERDVVGAKVVSGRRFVHGAPLGTKQLVFVGVALVTLVVLAVSDVVRAARRPRDVSPYEVETSRAALSSRDLWRSMLGLVVIGLVWDQAGERLPIVCAVGVLASRTAVNAILTVGDWTLRLAILFVGSILIIVAGVLLPRVSSWLGARRKKPEPAPQEAPPVIDGDLIRFAQMRGEMENEPPWNERAALYAFPLLHVVFAVGVAIELRP